MMMMMMMLFGFIGFLLLSFRYLFTFVFSRRLILIIKELSRNDIYEAMEIFFQTKTTSSIECSKISKFLTENKISFKIENGEEINDVFEGIKLKWRFNCSETQEDSHDNQRKRKVEYRFLELIFHEKHKEKVLNSYFPYVLERSRMIKEINTYTSFYPNSVGEEGVWISIDLEYRATFDTLVMDPDLKQELIESLKRVGEARKRRYLLYGPPGTGKSNLVVAMAEYLKFDIYASKQEELNRDYDELRNLLVATTNRSIISIEDIDCKVEVELRDPREARQKDYGSPDPPKFTLSGLLNLMDDLWSSDGDERIIVLTTNQNQLDWLDPSLLPRGSDMHIHMPYCTPRGFRNLADNYLGIENRRKIFKEIERLIEKAQVTPAEVTEELMKGGNVDTVLRGLQKNLKRKIVERNGQCYKGIG